jgi:hypothetical protein
VKCCNLRTIKERSRKPQHHTDSRKSGKEYPSVFRNFANSRSAFPAKIAEALKRNAALEAQKIWVETEGSKVILRGNLHSWLERAEAERVASAAPGVTAVENHINVTP